MPGIRDIRIQKLFLIAVFFKVVSAGLGWWLDMPWSLGLGVPLGVMFLYIMLGYYRSDRDVSDEKFADSCYYLGFIFTITAIIFSLFDLPNIGTQIQDIAVRFGAAMVSTVLGITVRVYLVSFKRDVADAIKDAEDAVISASYRLREQLVMAYEKLNDFQHEVEKAAQGTVERVNMQVEKLSKDHSTKLTEFFTDLTGRNQEAFTQALDEVKSASLRLSTSVDGYSLGMQSNLASIESKVGAFAEAVTDRLKTTTFPDDYFVKNLSAPLELLTNAATTVSKEVLQASQEVTASTVVLGNALKSLKGKATAVEGSLDTVLHLTSQQKSVLEAAQGQLTTLEGLGQTLSRFDGLLGSTVEGLTAASATSTALTERVEAIVSEGATSRTQLEASLTEVVAKLQDNVRAAQSLGAGMERTAVTSDAVISELRASVNVSQQVVTQLEANAGATSDAVARLDSIARSDTETARNLTSLGERAATALTKVDTAVEQLHAMVRHLSGLDTSLRAQGVELKNVVQGLQDIKVVVAAAPAGPGQLHDLRAVHPPKHPPMYSPMHALTHPQRSPSLAGFNGGSMPMVAEVLAPPIVALPKSAGTRGDGWPIAGEVPPKVHP